MALVNGWYLKSKKWEIYEDFHKGLRPKDMKDKYDLKMNTLYKYFEEFKDDF